MAKNGNGKIKLIGLLITVGIILVSIGIAWATLSAGVDHNKETDDKQDVRIDQNENDIDECQECIIKQTTHYEHILSSLDEIKKRLP